MYFCARILKSQWKINVIRNRLTCLVRPVPSNSSLNTLPCNEHTAPALRTHYAAISAEINEVKPDVLAELKNPLPINEKLSTPPNNVEVMGELKKGKTRQLALMRSQLA